MEVAKMLNSKDKNYVKEMTDRYVFEVTKRLPATQKSDIDMELRSLIEDMTSQFEGMEPEAALDAVLHELGKPADLADKYRENRRYLIGPAFYELYLLVLKIVVASVAIGLTAALSIAYIVSAEADPVGFGINLIATVLQALLQAVAWVTVIFAIVERCDGKKEKGTEESWKLSELPPIPGNKTIIKAWEPLVGIVFLVLVILLFNTAPQLIAVFYSDGGQYISIPVFDTTVVKERLLLINLSLSAALLKEAFHLLERRYTIRLAIATTICNVVGIGLLLYVFSHPAIWNPELGQNEILAIVPFLDMLKQFFAGVLVVVFLADTGTAWYRALAK
jgi:hypothetical protein